MFKQQWQFSLEIFKFSSSLNIFLFEERDIMASAEYWKGSLPHSPNYWTHLISKVISSTLLRYCSQQLSYLPIAHWNDKILETRIIPELGSFETRLMSTASEVPAKLPSWPHRGQLFFFLFKIWTNPINYPDGMWESAILSIKKSNVFNYFF